MYKVIAEREGEVVKDYGTTMSLSGAYLKIQEIDGPNPMDDPQWPEGCDAVVINLEDGDTVHLVGDAWENCTEEDRAATLVEHLDYEGIRDQDGWETLTLTVERNHPDQAIRLAILAKLSSTAYPVKVRMGRAAMDELHSCEYGSYEDHIHGDDSRDEPYDDGTLHIVELIERSPHKTVVYLENQAEVDEFFGQACTGTFGLYHLNICLRIYHELLPHVSAKAAKAVHPGTIGY